MRSWRGRAAAVFLAGGVVVASQAPISDAAEPGGARRPPILVFHGGVLEQEDRAPPLSDADTGLVLGVGAKRQLRPWLRDVFDAALAAREYDTPPGLTFAADDLIVQSLVMTYSLELVLPRGRVRPYAGAGAGLLFAELDVPSSLVPFASRLEEYELDLAWQIFGGAELDLDEHGERRLSFEVRELKTDARFESFAGTKIDPGGRAWLVVYARRL